MNHPSACSTFILSKKRGEGRGGGEQKGFGKEKEQESSVENSSRKRSTDCICIACLYDFVVIERDGENFPRKDWEFSKKITFGRLHCTYLLRSENCFENYEKLQTSIFGADFSGLQIIFIPFTLFINSSRKKGTCHDAKAEQNRTSEFSNLHRATKRGNPHVSHFPPIK